MGVVLTGAVSYAFVRVSEAMQALRRAVEAGDREGVATRELARLYR